ncbi:MAG TPA: alcohol dehydrogenase catalytic domain-containing protein, partial [Gemmatimonadales bacterium]|nr:alcohol dehydrogenase catalytic domain-containing protein [Gemmatimonadales bacterium]
MRYLRMVEDQGRYVASLPEGPAPTPARGEVLIRVAASGVNRADLLQIAGRYPPPPGEPEVLGLEVSGVLDETGEPVCALLAGGGHAECVAAPAGQVFPAPPGLDVMTGAGIPEAFLTAFVNLIVEGGLEREATVLVHAGASGVGLAA